MLIRTSAVAVLGLAVASCGGGGGTNDERAIHDLFGDFFEAFEDEDAGKLAKLLSEDCEDREQLAEGAIAKFVSQTADGGVEFEVTGVEFRNLTETTAQARPEGVSRSEGEEVPLSEEGENFASLEKFDNDWKFTDCNVLF